ncbi:MAG: aldehyde dehydrogenase family protein, partial [Microbacterium gubbeenense]
PGSVDAVVDAPGAARGGVVPSQTVGAADVGRGLASHADVDALDLTGAGSIDWIPLEAAAAETIKRVVRPSDDLDGSLQKIAAFTETKTVWHTKSLI